MEKFNKLLARCKCGVHIEINTHRDVYKSVKETLEDFESLDCPLQIDEDVRAEMIKRDTIVNIHFYPDTPIGFYDVYHYDFDMAVEQSLGCLVEEYA